MGKLVLGLLLPHSLVVTNEFAVPEFQQNPL